MKKHIVAGLIILLAASGIGMANTLNVRLNYFLPRAQANPNSLWGIEFENMSFKRSQFQEAYFGFGYEYFLSSRSIRTARAAPPATPATSGTTSMRATSLSPTTTRAISSPATASACPSPPSSSP
jgi:hypothetical protein